MINPLVTRVIVPFEVGDTNKAIELQGLKFLRFDASGSPDDVWVSDANCGTFVPRVSVIVRARKSAGHSLLLNTSTPCKLTTQVGPTIVPRPIHISSKPLETLILSDLLLLSPFVAIAVLGVLGWGFVFWRRAH